MGRMRTTLTAFLLTVGGLFLLLLLPQLSPPAARADAPWTTSVKVDDDVGTAIQWYPAIAVDGAGNAYSVWDDGRNGDSDIYFSYRPAGGSWGANVRVNDDAGTAYQGGPAIAVDGAGNAYAVWYDYRNGNDDIYFSYRPSGGSWGTNVKVNDDVGTASQGDPAIAVDGAGNAYALWMDWRNGDSDIYFAYRPAAGSWGTNVRVNDGLGGTASGFGSRIAVDGAGNAYALWVDHRNGNWDIYFSYRPAGGSWGANVKVNDDVGTADQAYPAIAVDGAGNAYAMWNDRRGDSWDIYFSYRAAGGGWGTNVKVNDDAGTTFQGHPAIAVDGAGNAYAVWHDYRNGNHDIYFSYRPGGGSWGSNVRVNDDVWAADQAYPAIAVDPSSNAYAVWQDYRNGNWDIYFSYRPALTYTAFIPIAVKTHPGGW